MKLIKSSLGSLEEPLSLQLNALRLAVEILQVGEQALGSIRITLIKQVGSLASVMVMVIFPLPAEPFCNWKGVVEPKAPEVGETEPLETETLKLALKLLPDGFKSKEIKSSELSELVLLSLQAVLAKPASMRLQVLEQELGSIRITLIKQVGSLASVMVMVIFPLPAEPFCNWKGVVEPKAPEVGETEPLETETLKLALKLLPDGFKSKEIKSSELSELVLLSLQAVLAKPASERLQVLEQLPGSVSVKENVHVGSLKSVMVIVTSPPPAELLCNWKEVLDPYIPAAGETEPALTPSV